MWLLYSFGFQWPLSSLSRKVLVKVRYGQYHTDITGWVAEIWVIFLNGTPCIWQWMIKNWKALAKYRSAASKHVEIASVIFWHAIDGRRTSETLLGKKMFPNVIIVHKLQNNHIWHVGKAKMCFGCLTLFFSYLFAIFKNKLNLPKRTLAHQQYGLEMNVFRIIAIKIRVCGLRKMIILYLFFCVFSR